METQANINKISPPGLFRSIISGFNAIANNIYIILFPIGVDLILWFGPKIRIFDLIKPIITEVNELITTIGTSEMTDILETGSKMWNDVIENYNMLSVLRTYPIGIPSLLAPLGIVDNPLIKPSYYEINSIGMAMGTWLLISLIGIAIGALFFNRIAITSAEDVSFSFKKLISQIIQSLFLTLLLILLVVIISIPTGFLISLISLISPAIAQISVFVITIFLLWMLLPLIFSPHGIFAYQQNAFTSLITSFRLVRFFLPGTGFFLLIALLISEGMDVIWRMPPLESWMSLIGIVGHSFISTALLAASFFYYRGGMKWMNDNLNKFTKRPV